MSQTNSPYPTRETVNADRHIRPGGLVCLVCVSVILQERLAGMESLTVPFDSTAVTVPVMALVVSLRYQMCLNTWRRDPTVLVLFTRLLVWRNQALCKAVESRP